jgi:hypothetical protein
MKRAGDSRDGAWLSDALRDQAQSHDADLERIQARFERLTAEPTAPRSARRRTSGPMRVRLLGIPLGIAAALASATVAVAVSVGIAVTVRPHPAAPVASLKTSAASTTASPEPTQGSTTPAAAATPSPGARANATAGATRRLAATGTVDPHSTVYWAQENLVLTPTQTIRDLRITVTVSGGSGVASTGIWTTLFATNIDTTVTRVPGGLVYQITLKPGQSLNPAVYRFGFQFNRPASGHQFALDTYTVSATGSDGAALSASGRFG